MLAPGSFRYKSSNINSFYKSQIWTENLYYYIIKHTTPMLFAFKVVPRQTDTLGRLPFLDLQWKIISQHKAYKKIASFKKFRIS